MWINQFRMERCFNSLIKKWDVQYKVELGCIVVSFKEDRVFGGFKRYRDLMQEAQLGVNGGKEFVHLAKKKREALVKLHCRHERCKNYIQEEDIEDLNLTQDKVVFSTTELVRELMNRRLVTKEMVLANGTNRKKLQAELEDQEVVWDDSLTDEDLSLLYSSQPGCKTVEKGHEQMVKQWDQLQKELDGKKKELESMAKVEEENVVLRQKVLQQQERIRELEEHLGELKMVKGQELCIESDEMVKELMKDKFVLRCSQAKEAMEKMECAWAEYKKVFDDGFLFNQVYFQIYNECG